MIEQITHFRPLRSLRRFRPFSLMLLTFTLLPGCSFAPKYKRPSVPTPDAYKESPSPGGTNLWKVAQPSDQLVRGDWWRMFNDPELNSLEEHVTVSNQNVAAAFANYLAAQAIVRETRAQLFPTLTANPSVTRSRQGFASSQPAALGRSGSTLTDYSLPLDASWQLDLWGRVRNAVKANSFEAQATAADLENTRLLAQSQLAVDYFDLHAQDALIQLYQETVRAYRESFELTNVRFQTGIASDEDVAQAATQLKTAQAQATSLGLVRAQLEHAIALLIGKPASGFSIPVTPLQASPPAVPASVPSQLLERRPDIAAAERRVAEANAQIGVAKAAYFPTVTLSAAGGFASTATSTLLDWPSRFWSIGAGVAETVFDAGLRRATVQQFRAVHESNVARYRQTVLTAFQQVEDNLAALRILAQQVNEQEAAVESSARYLDLAQDRYKLGIDSYLNVITAQTTLFSNRQVLVNIRTQLMTATVQLIQALGGGWDTAQLPTPKQLLSNSPASQGAR